MPLRLRRRIARRRTPACSQRTTLARVLPEPRLLALSARTGEGMDAWLDWLEQTGGG